MKRLHSMMVLALLLLFFVFIAALAVAEQAHAADMGGSMPHATPAPSCAVVSAVQLLVDGMYADVFCPASVIRVSVGALQPAPDVGPASLSRTAGGTWYLAQGGEAWRVVGP